jgi:hypothetical protein
MTEITAGQLPIPPVAQRDPKATELARVWAAEGAQHVSLRPDVWSDPAAWGILLVDLAKHVANALQEQSGRDPSDTLNRIRAGFDAEWSHATDEPHGEFLQ